MIFIDENTKLTLSIYKTLNQDNGSVHAVDFITDAESVNRTWFDSVVNSLSSNAEYIFDEDTPLENAFLNWQENKVAFVDFLKTLHTEYAHNIESYSSQTGDTVLAVLQLEDCIVKKKLSTKSILIIQLLNPEYFIHTNASENTDRVLQGIAFSKFSNAALLNEEEGILKIYLAEKGGNNRINDFWKDSFLQIKPVANNFLFTKELINLTRDFVEHKMPEEYQLDKVDQVALLQRSAEYFKTQPNYIEDEFASNIFQDEEVIASFKKHKAEAEAQSDFSFSENFSLDKDAVKKQSRFLKSVIKLDKNFHVYVHGNRDMIERGEDENGLKFYKLFYKEEN